jgi:acyl-coenzyme A synthetase/AMP-(fatty) acid ligase
VTGGWSELIAGERWRSRALLWVEDGTEYGAADVDALAAAVADAIRGHAGVRAVRVRAASKLGCFAGQLGAWRAGCVAVADPGTLGRGELDQVRPELTVDVAPGRDPVVRQHADRRLPADRIPAEVVAVNFTSGSTGSPKAVAVTRDNLLALFGCRGLDVPAAGRLTAGSFATAAYDGWWFDTWRTVAAGGTVVCLPGVNEDVFAWPELTAAYGIDRVLLPAAVVAAVIDAVPGCLAGIPWVFSGGEQFQVATYRKARATGLTARFVNLYGPTEATFATHRFTLPERLGGTAIPIGTALDGCEQSLPDRGGGARELVVSGPLVCLGYLAGGGLGHRFGGSYRTGDLVRVDETGNLVFAGRLDSRIKVNGIRVDAAALERRVTGLPAVSDCRVVQDDRHTVAFVRADDLSVRQQVESVVRGVSPAIRVQLVDRFPMKSGGKVDTATLMDRHSRTDKGGEQ